MARREPKKRVDTVSDDNAKPNTFESPFSSLAMDGLPKRDASNETRAAGPEPGAARESAGRRSGRSGHSGRSGRIVLRKEKAHRGGKTVIVADQFPDHLTQSDLEDIARELKKSAGIGGAVHNRTIELQTSDPAVPRSRLEALGFTVAGVR